jgi:hypothetical protein
VRPSSQKIAVSKEGWLIATRIAFTHAKIALHGRLLRTGRAIKTEQPDRMRGPAVTIAGPDATRVWPDHKRGEIAELRCQLNKY